MVDRRTKAELFRDCQYAEKRAAVLERILLLEASEQPLRVHDFVALGNGEVMLLEAYLYALTDTSGGYIIYKTSSSTAPTKVDTLRADLINNWLPVAKAGGARTVAYDEALKRLARDVSSLREETVALEKQAATSGMVKE